MLQNPPPSPYSPTPGYTAPAMNAQNVGNFAGSAGMPSVQPQTTGTMPQNTLQTQPQFAWTPSGGTALPANPLSGITSAPGMSAPPPDHIAAMVKALSGGAV